MITCVLFMVLPFEGWGSCGTNRAAEYHTDCHQQGGTTDDENHRGVGHVHLAGWCHGTRGGRAGGRSRSNGHTRGRNLGGNAGVGIVHIDPDLGEQCRAGNRADQTGKDFKV